MGRQAWLSILGLYEYDDTIFNNMYVPAGMDKDLLVNNILMECAELEILLPEPDVLRRAIGFWSRSQAKVWDKLYESTQFVYNPIWNKDGVIKETETHNLSEIHDLTATRDLKGTLDATDTDKRAAYNSSSFQNQDQTTLDHDTTDTGTVKDTGTLKDTGTITRDRTEQGNIGITTTQQMIKEEREVDQFSIYDYIVRSFKERFCILVY